MRNHRRMGIWAVIAIGLIVIAASSWHSVEEIHYLKTFYPDHFTVEEAFYASGVELIKVFLIAFPLLLLIGAGLYWLREEQPGNH